MHKLTLCLFLALALAQATPTAEISPKIQKALRNSPTVDIIVTFHAKTESVLSQHGRQSFPSRGARISALAASLQEFTSTSQKSVLTALASHKNVVRSYWSTNKIFVKDATLELIQNLAAMPEIQSIRENKRMFEFLPTGIPVPSSRNNEIQWGVEMVEAPAAWELGFRGQDVVVGILDTGVRYTHQILNSNYRTVRGWFDPYEGSLTPIDYDGHGSHVTGTIAGTNGYGVAPDAQWIACGTSFWENELLECGEFFICPTHANGTEPDCSAAPQVVSNSWGGAASPDVNYFDDTINAWNAAGIISVWSNGNNGDWGCNTPTYPKYTNLSLIACGAVDSDEELAYFSSYGPGLYSGADTIRPNVAAPGVNIISASGFSDTGFSSSSGTSMAAPHVSGVIALLMSNGTEYTFAEVTKFLYESAAHTVPPTGENCGGIPETEYPNNAVGHGRVTALGAISRAMESRR